MSLHLVRVVFAASFAALPATAQSWGVKTHDPLSGPPSTLFRLVAGAVNFVAEVKLAGAPIDVDGLAVDAAQQLYGFELTSLAGPSRLISIATTDGAATVVGPSLSGREIRGAAFTAAGRLLALDAAADELLEIDALTGLVVGSPIGLTLSAAPFDLSNVADLVECEGGALVVASSNQFYSLDPATGAMVSLHIDSLPGPDGSTVGVAGLMWGADTGTADRLGAYDVQQQDDIFAYDMAAGFARTLAASNIFPAYNAGRGDLASPPVGCPQSTLYCTAKVNSKGCTPSLTVSGTPQVANCATQAFDMTASNLIGAKNGQWFYSGVGPAGAAFAGGHLCVGAKIKRLPIQSTGGAGSTCNGVLTINFNARICGGTDPQLTAGKQVWAQAQHRDNGFAAPNNIALTNGVTFVICP